MLSVCGDVSSRQWRQRASPPTVLNVAILDLLEDFGPNRSVHILVLVDKLRLELYDLRDATTGDGGVPRRRSP